MRTRFVRVLTATTAAALIVGPAVTTAVAQDAGHLDPDFLLSIDDAIVHGTVTPPGAEITEKDKERIAYDELAYGYPTLTTEELTTKYFKDGSFDVPTDIAREYYPRSDVRVIRDAQWGVPHIYGQTDGAMAFGAGYAAAEDRLPIMELLRAIGRAEAFLLLETSEAWLMDAEMVRLYGYTDDEFQQMVDRMPQVYGQDGADLVMLLEEQAAGINHFILQAQQGQIPVPVSVADAAQQSMGPWSTKDIVAVVATVRSLFGAGGGTEVDNAARYVALLEHLGGDEAQARAIYEDFRNRFNLDSPVHTTGSFPYQQRDPDLIDPSATVMTLNSGDTGIQGILENLFPTSGMATNDPSGALSTLAAQLADLAEDSRIKYEHLKLDTELGSVDLSRPGGMSNFLIVDESRTSTGHPILLGGPQAGYFDPQILNENEIHSPTIHARGAGFPALNTLVIIGRNQEAAWTATAGGSDMIDIYVDKLCDPAGGEPDEQEIHYEFDGECVEMDRRVVRTVTDDAPADLPGRELLPDIYAERTVHGPVVARGRVGDIPVAVSRKRSTYLKELDPGISILKMNRNEAKTAADFIEIFETHNLSTNWGFASADEIGYSAGGLYPVRDPRIDADFPVWGTGEWEWDTDAGGNDVFLPREQVPYSENPDRGYLVSWNNRPAPDWSASDDKYGSSLYRSRMLEDQILSAAPGTIDPVRLTQMMEEAGLTDFRGSHVLPKALEVLAAGAPPGDREAAMVDLLEAWTTDGALRHDGDRDSSYDHGGAVAIMDAWWAEMIRAMYNPVLGDVDDPATALPQKHGFDNAPSTTGSAYQDGMYGQVLTDLRMVLGDPLDGPTSQVYCGSDAPGQDGDLATCAERLLASLVAAGDAVAEAQGSDDPTAWTTSTEHIQFLPPTSPDMYWVNRPTTQVLAMFGALTDDALPLPVDDPDDGTPATPVTGGGLAAVAILLALAAAATTTRRRPHNLR